MSPPKGLKSVAIPEELYNRLKARRQSHQALSGVNEQELKEKLAKWMGLKRVHVNEEGYLLYCAGGLGADRWQEVPDFPQSLDACSKWIVPERILEITFMYSSNCVSCDIEGLSSNFFEGHVNVESIEEAWTKSALALCLAVEKLIDSKKGSNPSENEEG